MIFHPNARRLRDVQFLMLAMSLAWLIPLIFIPADSFGILHRIPVPGVTVKAWWVVFSSLSVLAYPVCRMSSRRVLCYCCSCYWSFFWLFLTTLLAMLSAGSPFTWMCAVTFLVSLTLPVNTGAVAADTMVPGVPRWMREARGWGGSWRRSRRERRARRVPPSKPPSSRLA